MKALRIKLHQASANYRKEETAENKIDVSAAADFDNNWCIAQYMRVSGIP